MAETNTQLTKYINDRCGFPRQKSQSLRKRHKSTLGRFLETPKLNGKFNNNERKLLSTIDKSSNLTQRIGLYTERFELPWSTEPLITKIYSELKPFHEIFTKSQSWKKLETEFLLNSSKKSFTNII